MKGNNDLPNLCGYFLTSEDDGLKLYKVFIEGDYLKSKKWDSEKGYIESDISIAEIHWEGMEITKKEADNWVKGVFPKSLEKVIWRADGKYTPKD